jgi:AcrR family transcriptional regulator
MVFAINRTLVTQGVFGLTVRSIARESRISTGSLLHHVDSHERILTVAAHQTGIALLSEIASQAAWHGVEGFLPADDDTLLLTRELQMLAEGHEFRLSRPDLDLVAAIVEGLRGGICAPSRTMRPDRARQLLRAASQAALERCA